MYTVISAARISTHSFDKEEVKARADPWNPAEMLSGMPIAALTALMARTAWPRAVLGARLKETIDEGNCPWRLMVSGPVVSLKRAMAPRGTWPPPFAPRNPAAFK